MLLLLFVMAIVVMLIMFGGCNRGARIPGISWFDIPHESNRTARRKRR